MTRAKNRSSSALRLGLACLAGLSLASGVAADDGDPASATSGRMEDHLAESEDPDDRLAESEDPSGREAQSEEPAALESQAEQLDDHEAGSEALADHEASAYDLDALKQAAPDRGYDPIEMPGQSEWTPSTDPQVVVARRNLERAQEQAREARRRYGQMMEDGYPRGEARIRIIEARDSAEKNLADAKEALLSIDGGAPAAIIGR